MRCLIEGEDAALLGRMRRLARENGWGPLPAGALAKGEAEAPATIELALLCAANGLDRNGVRHWRQLLPRSVLLVLGPSSIDARKQALAAGANDFIQYDAPAAYLTARIGALTGLRPARGLDGQLGPALVCGPLEVDLEHRRCRLGGAGIALSVREFDLLAALASHFGETLTRSHLIERVWGAAAQPDDNALEMHVSRLRRKLGSDRGCHIVTLRGIGYRLQA